MMESIRDLEGDFAFFIPQICPPPQQQKKNPYQPPTVQTLSILLKHIYNVDLCVRGVRGVTINKTELIFYEFKVGV